MYAQRQRRRQTRRNSPDDWAPPVPGVRQLRETSRCSNTARRATVRDSTMLVLHDDVRHEYASGPAQGLPDSKVGTFTQELYDRATER